LQYEVQGRDSSFSVDDSQTTDKLAIVNKKVTTIEGYKVCYIVFMDVKRKIPSPQWEMNPRTPIFQPIAQSYID
jgi:hypothetical protein